MHSVLMKFNVVAKDVRSLPLNKQDVLIIIWRQAGTSRFGGVEIKSAAATGFSFHLTGLFLQVRPGPPMVSGRTFRDCWKCWW